MVMIMALRVMGKRQIGQLQLSELITAFLISDIASQPMTNENVPLLFAVVPVIAIICLEVILSFLCSKIPFLTSVLESPPSVVIRKGRPDREELLKIRMNTDELMSQLRLKGSTSPEDVEYAIFEHNGQLSVFPKTKTVTTGISRAVVIDGNIKKRSLRDAGKNAEWVRKKASEHGCRSLDEIFLFTVDDADRVFIVRKENK